MRPPTPTRSGQHWPSSSPPSSSSLRPRAPPLLSVNNTSSYMYSRTYICERLCNSFILDDLIGKIVYPSNPESFWAAIRMLMAYSLYNPSVFIHACNYLLSFVQQIRCMALARTGQPQAWCWRPCEWSGTIRGHGGEYQHISCPCQPCGHLWGPRWGKDLSGPGHLLLVGSTPGSCHCHRPVEARHRWHGT